MYDKFENEKIMIYIYSILLREFFSRTLSNDKVIMIELNCLLKYGGTPLKNLFYEITQIHTFIEYHSWKFANKSEII